jgi:DNA-binding MarR family transcriptional regulator
MTNARDFGALFNVASSKLSALGDRVLKPHGVTSAQWKVLVVLARHGDCRVSELVEVLDHDQAAVSRLVTRMERSKLVRRSDDPDDARAGFVSLTPTGRKTYQRCDKELRVVMGELESTLKVRERAELRRLLTRFTAAVEAQLGRAGA